MYGFSPSGFEREKSPAAELMMPLVLIDGSDQWRTQGGSDSSLLKFYPFIKFKTNAIRSDVPYPINMIVIF